MNMNKDIEIELDELNNTFSSIEKVLDLSSMKNHISDLELEASKPNLWDDPATAQFITSKLSNLQSEFRKVTNIRKKIDDLYVLIELASDENDDSAFEDAKNELEFLKKEI